LAIEKPLPFGKRVANARMTDPGDPSTVSGTLRQPYRGRLLNAKQIAEELFCGHVSPEWVRRNVPGKITLGHSTVVWYEFDVHDFIHNLKEV
jgi:hypothetical protein